MSRIQTLVIKACDAWKEKETGRVFFHLQIAIGADELCDPIGLQILEKIEKNEEEFLKGWAAAERYLMKKEERKENENE